MRALISLVFALLAAFAATAGAEPLGFDNARHLLNRAAYSADSAEIEVYAGLTREQAAERLLARAAQPRVTLPPAWTASAYERRDRFQGMSPEERKLAVYEMRQKAFDLQSWWLLEMLATPSPLAEKMTLFWHGHFASSQQKVRSPHLMYRQNVLLRSHALGNFGELLHAIARDPAMVLYLDSATNRKSQPNENFSRELMELFTVGEGNYTERDVKEVARAFTGWGIDPASGEFLFRRPNHDDGVKTVLGRTGNFDGDAVLDILLAQPQTAEFIVAKLWREFVSTQPDAAEVGRIARVFRESRYDVRAAVKALLVSDAFYAPANRAALIKSPVDLVVGTLRQFHFATGDVLPFVFAANQLGQALFLPPNVKGWPGGEIWINSSTLLARKSFLDRLFRADELRPMMAAGMTAGMTAGESMAAPRGIGNVREGRQRYMQAMAESQFDSGRWLGQFKGGDAAGVQRVLLAAAPVHMPLPGTQGMDLIRQLTQDPAYQLK